jgi:hypothetical protein
MRGREETILSHESMSANLNEGAPGLWFESTHPPVLTLPHLITALDAELIGKVTQLTNSRPGLWNVPAPFDEEDQFDNMRETTPLVAWGLPLNQSEVQAFGPLVTEAVFGLKLMFVDSTADERLLTEEAVPSGRRLETGAYVTQGYQDLPALPTVLESIGWALIPVGPERSRALFATSPARAEWVAKLCEWCEREGRNFTTAQREGEGYVFTEHAAPARYRENAIGHLIDGFLGDLESYFGTADESLLPVIEQRIRERRKLQQDVARLKGAARQPEVD